MGSGEESEWLVYHFSAARGNKNDDSALIKDNMCQQFYFVNLTIIPIL